MKTLQSQAKLTQQLTFLRIIPHYSNQIKQTQKLDENWKALQHVETDLRKALNLTWTGPQHDRLFSCLGSIQQLMTDVQQEIDKPWSQNSNGHKA